VLRVLTFTDVEIAPILWAVESNAQAKAREEEEQTGREEEREVSRKREAEREEQRQEELVGLAASIASSSSMQTRQRSGPASRQRCLPPQGGRAGAASSEGQEGVERKMEIERALAGAEEMCGWMLQHGVVVCREEKQVLIHVRC
jgi:hypothetical protein